MLAPVLSHLSRLAELNLQSNVMEDAGCVRLLTALPPLSPLHTLNLSLNYISPAVKEADALSRLSALTCLRLSALSF